MGSTRLPGKVLKKIGSKTLLGILIERAKKSKSADKIIVATTENPGDEKIADEARSFGADCFRGSENDVLDRYYQAAKKFGADIVVRITGDCPLMDPKVIDQVIGFYEKNEGDFDYVSNVHPPTFPDGMDVEVFSFKALEQSWKDAKLVSEREHVTQYMAKNPAIFRIGNVAYKQDVSAMRLTVDTAEDFELTKNIFENFSGIDFTLEDILELKKRKPEIFEINSRFERNEGLKKSIEEDKTI